MQYCLVEVRRGDMAKGIVDQLRVPNTLIYLKTAASSLRRNWHLTTINHSRKEKKVMDTLKLPYD